MNSEAIYFLKENPDKINWDSISSNSAIFILNPRYILEHKLTKKDIRQFAWEYPRTYLALRSFVEYISQAVYDPKYKWCQKRL